jgi:hypothetical protein
VAALAWISYDFGPSKITKTRIGLMESYANYFSKGYGQPPGAESVPEPRADEAIIFRTFFATGLRMPPHPVLTDILRKFGCISFHPNRYEGQARLTLVVRNKWTSGRDDHLFYYRVPLEQLPDIRGKGNYPLRSTMTPLDYLNDAPFECCPENANVAAFVEATSIIGGRDAVKEFLACGIGPLSNSCSFEVETKETPLSKVIVPMPKVTPAIGAKENGSTFETRIVNATNLLIDKYNVVEHNAYTGLRHGCLNHILSWLACCANCVWSLFLGNRKLLLYPRLRLQLHRKPVGNEGAQRCRPVRGIKLPCRS